MNDQNKIEYIKERYPDSYIMDGFDDAIIGVDCCAGKIVYSFEKMISVLMERDKMKYDDAVEYIDYNCVRTIPYYGELSPIIVDDL